MTDQPIQTSVDVKLDYIQRDIRDIRSDINIIKNDFVSRREFTDAIKTVRDAIPNEDDHEKRIRSLEQFKWQLIGGMVVLQAVADYVLYLVLKK